MRDRPTSCPFVAIPEPSTSLHPPSRVSSSSYTRQRVPLDMMGAVVDWWSLQGLCSLTRFHSHGRHHSLVRETDLNRNDGNSRTNGIGQRQSCRLGRRSLHPHLEHVRRNILDRRAQFYRVLGR